MENPPRKPSTRRRKLGSRAADFARRLLRYSSWNREWGILPAGKERCQKYVPVEMVAGNLEPLGEAVEMFLNNLLEEALDQRKLD